MATIFNNPVFNRLTSELSSVTDKLYEEANKNPLQPGAMTTDQLLKAGYKLGTTTAYDSDIGYYEVPTWVDSKGNNIGLSPQQVAANDRAYEAQVRAAEETAGNFRYIGYGADPEGNNPIGYVKVPKASSAYRTPESISSNPVFQDVNAYSSGQLGRIVDAINSGEYKITDDKSQMVTPYGSYTLRPLGNGLYDIPIGARSGSYNVAIGVNDKGEAQFDKKFLDAGAIRYQGGSSGSFLQNFVQDVGPVGNIALAVATGGLSIPEQIAAHTAYNMVGGAEFEDALKGAALNVALSEGVKASGLLGGDATKTSFAPEMGDELIPFDEGLTGIDIGDVIPATPAQLEGLYNTGGVFGQPDASTGGGELGENVPSGIDKWDEAFIRAGGIFNPEYVNASTGGMELGENVPSGIPLWDEAFIKAGGIFNPEYVNASTGGMELGEGVPSGVAAWDKAYIDAGGTFLPGTTTNVVDDYFKSDSTLTTPVTLPSLKDLANTAVIAGTVNSLVNPPSLGGGPTTGGGGFNIVPVPSDWKSPTYNQQFTPLDINSLFTTANLLKGTQWENLPPEIQFVPTIEALTNIISNGQTSTSN